MGFKWIGIAILLVLLFFATRRTVRALAHELAHPAKIAFWAGGSAFVVLLALLYALGGTNGIFNYFAERPEGLETATEAGFFGLGLVAFILAIFALIFFFLVWDDGMEAWRFADWRRQVKREQEKAKIEWQRRFASPYTEYEL